MNAEGELIEAVKLLISKVNSITENMINSRVVEPKNELFLCTKVKNYEYNDNGVENCTKSGGYIYKKSWSAAISIIANSIFELDEYLQVLGILTNRFENTDFKKILESFIEYVIEAYIKNTNSNEQKIVDILIKNVKSEGLKWGANVELEGIIIMSDKIEIESNEVSIVLRKPEVNDLETEQLAISSMHDLSIADPTAILHIESIGNIESSWDRERDTQMNIMKVISILRLFNVGSVRYIKFSSFSESLMELFLSGMIASKQLEFTYEKLVIRSCDIPKLKSFWSLIEKQIPESFYNLCNVKQDYISIAYDMYCEGLLKLGVIEKRIANAIMGYESLFLKDSENMELKYRLGIRVAKVFSLLTVDAFQARKIVEISYDIRSKYVHGSQLSDRDEKKYSKMFGSISDLASRLFNNLRVSIVIMILAHKSKEEFIELIDESLFDIERNKELEDILTTIRDSIFISNN